MTSRRPLTEKALLSILENWSNIDSEDEDDVPFVPSPRKTFLQLPDDDIIDSRLEQLFCGTAEDNVGTAEEDIAIIHDSS